MILVQPPPGERMSGGYLYNAEMARHNVWNVCNLAAGDLETALPTVAADLLIADSIWLTEQTFGPFLHEADSGRHVGVMLHSFPSMIAATEGRHPPRVDPDAFEIDALKEVGLAVLPGRHYADLLTRHRVDAVVCPPGVPDDWRRPPRRRTGICSLLSLGAVTPRKGYLDVLEAMRPHMAVTPFRWTIVGSLESDPVYAAAVTDLAREFPAVRLIGQLDRERVANELFQADVLVMPSYDENQPLVVLEAMAASVPTVAYAAGATAQMIEHGREGLVVPVGDRTALRECLLRLVRDENERFRLAEGCWDRQRAVPNWATAARTAREALTRFSRAAQGAWSP
jgi:glycosyltransferase involved in cell wall biosynthesis